MKIGEVCLHTLDVIRLADFYKRLLQVDNQDVNDVHQFILAEETTLAIWKDESKNGSRNENISLAFTVDNIQTAYAHVRTMGAVILQEPQMQPWGACNMCLLDPDGNRIYLRQLG